MTHISCINPLLPEDNPNDGRIKINQSFACVNAAIDNLEVQAATGSTSVSAGLNTSVSLAILSGTPNYEVSIFESAITASVTYTNPAATPYTVGGIIAGSTFSGKTMQEMWDLLLYPYLTPSFASFANSGLLSVYEVGQTIATGSQSFSWSFNNLPNVSANTTTIVQNISPVTTLYGPASNTSPSALTLTAVYSAGTSTTTTLYTISAINTSDNSFSTTISRSWKPKIYYGTNSASVLVEADIKALISNPLSNTFAGTYSFGANNYKYFCYPSSFGTATVFTDTGTNFPVAMDAPYLVSVTNTYGVTLSYRVHRTYNIMGGSINIQIS